MMLYHGEQRGVVGGGGEWSGWVFLNGCDIKNIIFCQQMGCTETFVAATTTAEHDKPETEDKERKNEPMVTIIGPLVQNIKIAINII